MPRRSPKTAGRRRHLPSGNPGIQGKLNDLAYRLNKAWERDVEQKQAGSDTDGGEQR